MVAKVFSVVIGATLAAALSKPPRVPSTPNVVSRAAFTKAAVAAAFSRPLSAVAEGISATGTDQKELGGEPQYQPSVAVLRL